MAMFGRSTQEDERRAQAYGVWLRSRDPYAVASLVLGIFSLIEFGALIVFGVGGIVCGAIALRRLMRDQPKSLRGKAMAWWGIVTSVLSLVLAALLYLRVFG